METEKSSRNIYKYAGIPIYIEPGVPGEYIAAWIAYAEEHISAKLLNKFLKNYRKLLDQIYIHAHPASRDFLQHNDIDGGARWAVHFIVYFNDAKNSAKYIADNVELLKQELKERSVEQQNGE